jgi:hypothetical protein
MNFPFVDLETEKIYGCKKGSWFWFHEKGHIEFNKKESTARLKIIQTYCFYIWMFSITLGILNKFMIFISLPLVLFYIGVELYEEKWANEYANKKFNK